MEESFGQVTKPILSPLRCIYTSLKFTMLHLKNTTSVIQIFVGADKPNVSSKGIQHSAHNKIYPQV